MTRRPSSMAVPQRAGAVVTPDEVRTTAARAIQTWNAGRSPKTVLARLRDLDAFVTWHDPAGADRSAERAVELLVAAGPVGAREAALGWRTHLEDEGLAASTIARRLSTLQSLVRELGEYHLPWTLRVRLPKVDPYSNAEGPAPEVVEGVIARLRTQADSGERGATRDLAILLLLYDGALRRESVAGLKVADYERAKPQVRVKVKGGRWIWRTLSRRCADAIDAWIELAEKPRGGKVPLFDSFRGRGAGEGLSADGIATITRREGLGGPHGMRHAAATRLAELGDVLLVQQLLGHASIQTSQVYVDRLRDDPGRASRILAGEEAPRGGSR